MTPSLVLAFVLSSLYGLIFFVIFGKGWDRLALYWLVGVAGFAVGQWLGSVVGIALLNIGMVNFFEGTVVSFAGLLAVRALRH